MARGDKLVNQLAGAMGKSPSMAGMTRVSPGVYRNAQGQLVRGMGGQPRPRQQQAPNQATANAVTGQQSYGNVPPMENMQTLPYLPTRNMSREQFQQFLESVRNNRGYQDGFGKGLAQGILNIDPGQMQQPQLQSDRFVGDPWRAMRDGSGKGGLQNMALRARNQNQQMQQAAQQQAAQQAMQQLQGQPQQQPMPMPGRGYRR